MESPLKTLSNLRYLVKLVDSMAVANAGSAVPREAPTDEDLRVIIGSMMGNDELADSTVTMLMQLYREVQVAVKHDWTVIKELEQLLD